MLVSGARLLPVMTVILLPVMTMILLPVFCVLLPVILLPACDDCDFAKRSLIESVHLKVQDHHIDCWSHGLLEGIQRIGVIESFSDIIHRSDNHSNLYNIGVENIEIHTHTYRYIYICVYI